MRNIILPLVSNYLIRLVNSYIITSLFELYLTCQELLQWNKNYSKMLNPWVRETARTPQLELISQAYRTNTAKATWLIVFCRYWLFCSALYNHPPWAWIWLCLIASKQQWYSSPFQQHHNFPMWTPIKVPMLLNSHRLGKCYETFDSFL